MIELRRPINKSGPYFLNISSNKLVAAKDKSDLSNQSQNDS